MKKYGKNYVLAEIPVPGKTHKELNSLADDFDKMADNPRNWKQAERLRSDAIQLRLFADRAQKGECFGLFIRQYTGHKYQPNRVNGKYLIKWISEFIAW